MKYIREDAADIDTPIIMMTGFSENEDLAYVSSKPKTRILEKPFEYKQFIKAVSDMLSGVKDSPEN